MSDNIDTAPAEQPSGDAPAEQPSGDTLLDTPIEQPSGDAPAEQSSGDTPTEQPSGAPEKYEAPTLPEGMELDNELLTVFDEKAKSMNLSQAGRDELVNMYAGKMAEMHQFYQNKAVEDRNASVTKWDAEVKADPTIGGDNINATIQGSLQVLKKFDPDGAFKEHLHETGIGSSPATLKFLTAVRAAISEDVFVDSNTTGKNKEKPLAQRMYPDMNP